DRRHNMVAPGQQLAHHRAADEARPTGDEGLHPPSTALRSRSRPEDSSLAAALAMTPSSGAMKMLPALISIMERAAVPLPSGSSSNVAVTFTPLAWPPSASCRPAANSVMVRSTVTDWPPSSRTTRTVEPTPTGSGDVRWADT